MTDRLANLVEELVSDEGYVTGRRSFPRTVTGDDAVEIANALHVETDSGCDARARAAARDGAPLACGRGCNGCCEELVVIWRPEALAIARWLERPENEAARARFLEAYPKWHEAVGDAGDRLGALLAAGDKRYTELHVEQWRKRILCAFNEGGDCSIYPVRPIACRNAHAVGTSERCSGDSPQPATRVNFVPLDRFVARARRLIRAAHHAIAGKRVVPSAMCDQVHRLLMGEGGA